MREEERQRTDDGPDDDSHKFPVTEHQPQDENEPMEDVDLVGH